MNKVDSNIVLTVKNLSVSFHTYGGLLRAVRNVNFELHKGETLAIVGESGSGKSVTIKSVLRILPKNAVIESGEIEYEKRDLLRLPESKMCGIRGKKIALVFQDPLSSLNPIMKIGKQIQEAIMLDKTYTSRQAKEKTYELLEAVGIDRPKDRYNQYPFQFSGGMRQRIVIAIALSRNPDVLICDEPTTALDVTVQSRILEMINNIKESKGLSVIFITHDMGVVANMADRICVMYAGKILEKGLSEEIFFNPVHPYTQMLLASVPDMDTVGILPSIPGTPPNMLYPPKGDAFAQRNPYAMRIDFEREPPLFPITETHWAATWLLHPNAPKVDMPAELKERIERMRGGNGQ